MKATRTTSRIHLLVAKEAPVAVIIRRKPTKWFHIIKWNLETDELESGSWFHGKFYSMRSDLSWDGKYMVYLAMGDTGTVWNGVCEPPRLKTLIDWENFGTWAGSGVFWRRKLLLRNLRVPAELREQESWDQPFNIDELEHGGSGEDVPLLFFRLHRDGWRPLCDGVIGEAFDAKAHFQGSDPSGCPWVWRYDSNSPLLTTRLVGYRGFGRGLASGPLYEGRSGYLFHFELEGYADLLGPQVEWATWASTGDLIWTRDGAVFRLSQAALRSGQPPDRFEFEHLAPPVRKPLCASQ